MTINVENFEFDAVLCLHTKQTDANMYFEHELKDISSVIYTELTESVEKMFFSSFGVTS